MAFTPTGFTVLSCLVACPLLPRLVDTMKEETKLDKLLALLGIEDQVSEADKKAVLNSADAAKKQSQYQEKVLSQEAVALYIDNQGQGFQKRLCKLCDRNFAVSLNTVSFCSDLCREAWLDRLGIQWNWGTPLRLRHSYSDVGGRTPVNVPLVVPPDALSLADAFLRKETLLA